MWCLFSNMKQYVQRYLMFVGIFFFINAFTGTVIKEKFQKNKKSFKKLLTNGKKCDNIYEHLRERVRSS